MQVACVARFDPVLLRSAGTIPYMPPELLSAGKMSRKADVRSIAVSPHVVVPSARIARHGKQAQAAPLDWLQVCHVQVFSFGIIAWQIFTGQGPHAGMGPMQVRLHGSPASGTTLQSW